MSRKQRSPWVFTITVIILVIAGLVSHFTEQEHSHSHLIVWAILLSIAFLVPGTILRPDIFCCKFGSHNWNYELAKTGERLKTGYRWCTRCPKHQIGTPCEDKLQSQKSSCPVGPNCGCLEWKNVPPIPKAQERKK